MPLGSFDLWRRRVAFRGSIVLATAAGLSCSAPDGSGLFQPFEATAGAASGGVGGATGGGTGGSGVGVAGGGTSAGSNPEGQGGNLALAGASGSAGSGAAVGTIDAGASVPEPTDPVGFDGGVEPDAAPAPTPVTCEPSAEVCDGLDNDCDDAIDSGDACPAGCTGFTVDAHAYMFCAEGVNRAVALASCAEEAMKLAWIETPDENDALVVRIGALGAPEDELLVHIGGSDQAGENEWSWVGNDAASDGFQFWQGNAGGEVVDGAYANWATGEPNNTGNEDCAAMSVTGSALREPGQWDDRTCATVQPFLCEDP